MHCSYLLNVLFSFCFVCQNTCIFIHHSAVHTCLLLVVLHCNVAAWTWGKYIRAMDFHLQHMGSWAWIKCVWYERKKESCSTISIQQSITGRGTWWRSWLRHCATSQKVAGSIPDGVIGIFHWLNPSSCTMALGSTQPETEMSTRNISCRWGKGSLCVRLTTLPPSCADCLQIWEPQPPGTLRDCPGL